MRVLYPDIVYGAIASSGVTHATVVDWRYPDLIRQYAAPACVARIEKAIAEVDSLLTSNKTSGAIKAVFGLGGISYNPDFASLLSVRARSWCWCWSFVLSYEAYGRDTAGFVVCGA